MTSLRKRHLEVLRRIAFAAAVAVSLTGVARPSRPVSLGSDAWGGIPSHPAVVNPVGRVDDGSWISLRGEWDFIARDKAMRRSDFFRTEDAAKKLSPWEVFKVRDMRFKGHVRVPGAWSAQGVGAEGCDKSLYWWWDNSTPPRRTTFDGDACYRRRVRIPAEWKGRRVWIKAGKMNSVGWIWVNREQVAMVTGWCDTRKWEITGLVKPGEEAEITIEVISDVLGKRGYDGVHGGILRDVELEATPQAFVDDAWVRGDFDRGEAEAHVRVEKVEGVEKKFTVRVEVEGAVAEADAAKEGETVVRLPLKDFRPWSPEHPNLYWAEISLVEDGRVVHVRRERFGVRKLEVKDGGFLLNGKPFFFRGAGHGGQYPLTLASPADREYHRGCLLKAKAAGFNYLRTHTRCENPEFFEAADEVGILVQPELPYYWDYSVNVVRFDPYGDVDELWRNFRRYPSFAVYSTGNEGTLGRKCSEDFYRYVKELDPDRLVIHQDGGRNSAKNSDFASGPVDVWKRHTDTGNMWQPEGYYGLPFICHEYLNAAVKADPRDESLFTSSGKPKITVAERESLLKRAGCPLEFSYPLQEASHRQQRAYHRYGIEVARCDPRCGGYAVWSIADVANAQGVFSVLWTDKRGVPPADELREVNSSRGLFADIGTGERLSFRSGDRVKVDFLFANFSGADCTDREIAWKLEGTSLGGRIPAGPNARSQGPARAIGTLELTLPETAKPLACTLSASFGGAANRWQLWVFPRARRTFTGVVASADLVDRLSVRYGGIGPFAGSTSNDVLVTTFGSEEMSAHLKRGGRVIALGGGNPGNSSKMGWWSIKFCGEYWARTAAFGGIPTCDILPRQLAPYHNYGQYMGKLKFLAPADILSLTEHGSSFFINVYQCRAQGGRLLVNACYDVLADDPAMESMLAGFIDYVRSDAVAPTSDERK